MQYIPRDIVPKDDAFHGSYKRICAEWWYFDAIFKNGYSAHIGLRTYSRWRLGFIIPSMEIYKEGKIISRSSKVFPFRYFDTSREVPLVKIYGKPILVFDMDGYKSKNKWRYSIYLDLDTCKADLDFEGETKGWKMETYAESWCVALPRARVKGKLHFNEKEIGVEGIGYHDHNWNYSFLTVLRYGKGWFWGRVNSDNFTVVWASIIREKLENIAVVNKREGDYLHAEKVSFKPSNFVNGIPTVFHLQLEGKDMKGYIKMYAKEMHRERIAFLLPYCRYHVESEGYVKLRSSEEKIKGFQIMEFLSFGKRKLFYDNMIRN